VTTKLTPTQIAATAYRAGFRGAALVTAIAVALAESAGVVDNVSPANNNGTRDYGLWQINSVHTQYDKQLLISDPLYNARAAFAISNKGTDFGPWTTYDRSPKHPYNNGAYRKNLPTASAAATSSGLDKMSIPGTDNKGGGLSGIVDGGLDFLDPFGAVPGHGSPIGPGVSGAVKGAMGVGDFLGALSSPHTWLRVAKVVGGLALLGGGLVLAFRKDLVGTVGNAVPGAIAGKAISVAPKAAAAAL
jgi:hypothetical protein